MAPGRPPAAGYRLDKLEVLNWGGFDGKVHTLAPMGQTTLLVGENGSGKSTLVDALLTLLVRPQQRSYNIAAGAHRSERDERSYIRGAYDRTVGEDGRPEMRYLRGESDGCTVLLASFRDASTSHAFTVAQVLKLSTDGAVERVYAFSPSQRSIVRDLANLSSSASISKQLRDRGFDTTSSFQQYSQWLQNQSHLRSKAMDVFGQTVAVKDVQRLDLFIRQHMLDKQPWEERIQKVVTHFDAVYETHRKLKRLKLQLELLQPIVEAGAHYHARQAEWVAAKSRLDAMPAFFADATCRLLAPHCESLQQSIAIHHAEIKRLDKKLERLRVERSRVEAGNADGNATMTLELELKRQHAEELLRIQRDAASRFQHLLQSAGVRADVGTAEAFSYVRSALRQRREEILSKSNALGLVHQKQLVEIATAERRIAEHQDLLNQLARAKCNLAGWMLSVRDRICDGLGIAPEDLLFAAELIDVKPEESAWRGALEAVLDDFARSLLVPELHYRRVVEWIDGGALVDAQGIGVRLNYRCIPADAMTRKAPRSTNPLLAKLRFRRHALTPWLQQVLSERLSFSVCESVGTFLDTTGPAIMSNRHFKRDDGTHTKEDRAYLHSSIPCVLGWDNREQQALLRESIRIETAALVALRRDAQTAKEEIEAAAQAMHAVDQALMVSDYESIDCSALEANILKWNAQLHPAAAAHDAEQPDAERIAAITARWKQSQHERDQHLESKARLAAEHQQASKLLAASRLTLSQLQSEAQWDTISAQFPAIADELKIPLTLETLTQAPVASMTQLRQQVEALALRVHPASKTLIAAMARYLRAFPEETTDIDPDVSSLDYFVAQNERILEEGLPSLEERFRARLNEKILHEIGLLHHSFEADRAEILQRVEQLNQGLRLMQWQPGTTMRLEATDVHDQEILAFRKELASCLNGTFSSSRQENDIALERIQALIQRFKAPDLERWRNKVMDVRNWFQFAAREIVSATGESRSYYDGGSGQSGGEKGKLAFLVLAASIAYQYDLKPLDDNANRFHLVMVDEMFSRSDDAHAEYALDLFSRFGLQLLIVAPLDAKIRVTEPHVGVYVHVVKDRLTHRSSLVTVAADALADNS